MNSRQSTKSQPRKAPPRACDDPLVDYLAVSVSRCASGRLRVHTTKMDLATRRVITAVLFDDQEARTSPEAMAEWLARGTAEHLLDVEDQLRLW